MLRLFTKSLIILVLCLAISACGQTDRAPVGLYTQTPTLILTRTQMPSLTPSPTPSPTATLTPFPTLSGNKPYLMIQQDDQVFIEYDANGFGRKLVKLPPDGHIPTINSSLERIVSPDGKWLAFYTGNFEAAGTPANLPIALKLLNISDGTVRKVADVVTDGYIVKLDQAAEKIKILYPYDYNPLENNDWVSRIVRSDFEWSIHSVSWSPDGRTLAFAAQIDGISSDVYLYNLETGSIQQVENSLQSVSRIDWSPDGKHIVFRNSHPTNSYTRFSLYAVRPGNQMIDNPQEIFNRIWPAGGGWLSPNLLLVADGSDTGGDSNLQALDINTGQLKSLWPDVFWDYAIDPVNKIIAVNTSEFAEPETMGLYLVTFDGKPRKVSGGLYGLYFRGGTKHHFLAQGSSDAMTQDFTYADVVGIDLNGNSTYFGKFANNKISISPDHAWMLIYDDEKLYLYDANDELMKTFPINGIQGIIWRPDSQAIFYSNGKELFILPIPNGEPRLVDECEQPGCLLDDIVWLP